ncbi:Diphthamide biosynthesis protein [Lasiodiplodia theobromae]|uniref:Diphthamide biosynthesis protein n=1 Tax=Lasiodiplodia theobromae TaxID=45133 RepID=UPI0015C40AEB|nr:Diphthamide biosynthesis protein [Lasiodiplodia theobromae]KAF4541873.1 Diphthamide biosynthesis protein [Lasiodiplodia theobromae]
MEALTLPVASPSNLFGAPSHDQTPSAVAVMSSATVPPSTPRKPAPKSRFESILTTHPTIAESLLASLPTRSLIDLFHTSRHLRCFLAEYPLAWRTLSFRAPQPALGVNNPDGDALDGPARNAKQYALDALLIQVVVPFGTRLTSLDLCNTAVSGVRLVSRVLEPRVHTLQHLSVRGCKNVSIKYHLVPFLEPYVHPGSPWAKTSELALRSLYTYRCRHHRRRPYLPSSLMRRDSDSEPTHQLIEICHQLGIWTDTMWCTTPGGRCFRRKDYYSGRAAPGTNEVWVPFDRLWRSGNRIGPPDSDNPPAHSDGRMWEDAESGHDGEPLGTSTGWPHRGEGKDMPAHLRRSHRIFVDDIKCDQCGDAILERPIPRKRRRTNRAFTSQAFGTLTNLGVIAASNVQSNSQQTAAEEEERKISNRFWWAPGATRSPNLMTELASDDDASDSDEPGPLHGGNPLAVMNVSTPPKLNMNWCCVEPVFSGGGGIVVLGPGVGGRGADRIRATPLPKGQQFEDADFMSVLRSPELIRELKNATLYEHVLGEHVDIVPYLQQDHLDLQAATCPRSLCQDCYRTFRWKVACKACKKPLCKEHDFRGLKVRKCGYRELHLEREYLRAHTPTTLPVSYPDLHIPAYVPPTQRAEQSSAMETQDSTDSHSSSNPDLRSITKSFLFTSNPNEEESDMSNSIPALKNLVEGSSGVPFSSRPRALSASENRSPRSLSPWAKGKAPNDAQQYALSKRIAEMERARMRLPLPGTPRHPVQWRGCGAYFCQQLRPVGDCRPRCNAGMRECGDCGVLVCDGCLNVNPPCPCAYCSTHYHCPVCSMKPRVQTLCRRDAERQAARLKELAEAERRAKEAEALVRADEMALAVGEFFRDFLDVGGALFEQNEFLVEDAATSEFEGEGVRHIEVAAPAPLSTPSLTHPQDQYPNLFPEEGPRAESSAMGAAAGDAMDGKALVEAILGAQEPEVAVPTTARASPVLMDDAQAGSQQTLMTENSAENGSPGSEQGEEHDSRDAENTGDESSNNGNDNISDAEAGAEDNDSSHLSAGASAEVSVEA